jgi:hypothetical protein
MTSKLERIELVLSVSAAAKDEFNAAMYALHVAKVKYNNALNKLTAANAELNIVLTE